MWLLRHGQARCHSTTLAVPHLQACVRHRVKFFEKISNGHELICSVFLRPPAARVDVAIAILLFVAATGMLIRVVVTVVALLLVAATSASPPPHTLLLSALPPTLAGLLKAIVGLSSYIPLCVPPILPLAHPLLLSVWWLFKCRNRSDMRYFRVDETSRHRLHVTAGVHNGIVQGGFEVAIRVDS